MLAWSTIYFDRSNRTGRKLFPSCSAHLSKYIVVQASTGREKKEGRRGKGERERKGRQKGGGGETFSVSTLLKTRLMPQLHTCGMSRTVHNHGTTPGSGVEEEERIGKKSSKKAQVFSASSQK